MDNIILQGPHKDFEGIKHIDMDGVEYWLSRELMFVLGYDQWKNFEDVIKKAQIAALKSGQDIHNHFSDVGKMVKIGTNTVREVKDYKLDRYACYLIAQNGDARKPQIAQAQTYFATQTRKHEIFENLNEADKRLYTRDQVKFQNKKLMGTAKSAGVTKFGVFNDAGYLGLYGMRLADIEKKKDIKKGELLDRAGTTELAANLFRITQTESKLTNENIRGENLASRIHNMVGGKVRQTIKDIGGVLPEDLPAERHIKELVKEKKSSNKSINQKIKRSIK